MQNRNLHPIAERCHVIRDSTHPYTREVTERVCLRNELVVIVH